MRKRNVEKQKQQSFLQGILPGLVPITLLSFFFVPDYIPGLWKLAAGSMIPLLPGLGITLLFRFPTAVCSSPLRYSVRGGPFLLPLQDGYGTQRTPDGG